MYHRIASNLSHVCQTLKHNISDNRPLAVGYFLIWLATCIIVGVSIYLLDMASRFIYIPEFAGNNLYFRGLINTVAIQAVLFVIACLLRRFWQVYVAEVIVNFIGVVIITSLVVMSNPHHYHWISSFLIYGKITATTVVNYAFPIIACGLCLLGGLPLPQSRGWQISK